MRNSLLIAALAAAIAGCTTHADGAAAARPAGGDRRRDRRIARALVDGVQRSGADALVDEALANNLDLAGRDRAHRRRARAGDCSRSRTSIRRSIVGVNANRSRVRRSRQQRRCRRASRRSSNDFRVGAAGVVRARPVGQVPHGDARRAATTCSRREYARETVRTVVAADSRARVLRPARGRRAARAAAATR